MLRDINIGLRNNNRQRIFRYIYDAAQPITKQDLADALNLSLPTVSMYLADLMNENLLKYGDTVASTGGRKPRAIDVVVNRRIAIGISIGEKTVRMVALNVKVDEIAYQKYALPFEDSTAYYQTLSARFEEFVTENSLAQMDILGVGITLPGIINHVSDMLEYAPRLRLRKKPLAEIRRLFPFTVFFMNDAFARGFVEWWNRPEYPRMVYLSVDRGVGGSILFGQTPYLGENGRSAEFGHMCIVSNGRLCSCGQKGCFEAYCSVSRISDELDMSLEEFFGALDAQNRQIAIVWKEYLTHLAQGIVNIRSVLDCEIILGGMLAPFMDKHIADLYRNVVELSSFDTDGRFIHLCHHRNRSSGVGAALHFIDEFIQAV